MHVLHLFPGKTKGAIGVESREFQRGSRERQEGFQAEQREESRDGG
jgi:hypothetical protein